MRSSADILATARDTPPFSNASEADIWKANWCDRCHNPVEKAWQAYESGKRKTQLKGYEGGCPLIMCAYLGQTPTEWLEQPGHGDYQCIEYRGPDDGPGEPRPRPDPPGMDGLFDQPERRTRMLKQADVMEAANA